jgi:hypothetical protein
MSTPHDSIDAQAALDPRTPPEATDAPHSAPGAAAGWWQTLQALNASRPRLPNENALTLGAGALLLLSAVRSRSVIGRLLQAAVGGALVGRAISEQETLGRAARVIATVGRQWPRRAGNRANAPDRRI